MIKNYFKTALRSLARNRLYTLLNIAGLTFGISCFLIIGLYLFDEWTFDTQHLKADRIFRVVEHKTVDGESTVIAGAGFRLAEESRKTIPGVENTTRIQRTGRGNIFNPENPSNFFQETVTVADESFLKIFDFPLLKGNRNTALVQPNSIVITEDLAMRLFDHTDVVGKTLQFGFMESPMKVTGLLKNHPRNSSFDFSSVMSESSQMVSEGFRNLIAADWLSTNFSVYALLKEDAVPNSIASKMSKLVDDNFEQAPGTQFFYSLQPLKRMHLHSGDIVDGARNSNVEAIAKGNKNYIRIFSLIALFVLLVAGINYMNLTTARASGRLKEIGVRKTIGALQKNLIGQFLFESLLITFFSFLLSLIVVNIVLPGFNQFTNKQLSLGIYTDYRIWMYAIAFVILTGFLAGSYPAILLSGYKPILLLRGLKLKNRTDLSLRKGLVVFQFAISVILIIGTIALYLQVRYLSNTHLGFNKNLLVVIDVNTGRARANFESVKTEMARIPAVQNVSVTSRVPGEWKQFRNLKINTYGSAGEAKVAYMIGADKDFLKTFQIPLLKGRNFSSPADSSGILLNETAANMLKLTEAGGQLIQVSAISRSGDGIFEPFEPETPFNPVVLGIVKDFHFQSLRDKIEPLVICHNNNPIHGIDYYTARIDAANINATLEKLKAVMVNNDKDDPFEYHFLDDQLARFYIQDSRNQTILIWAALATIFIACLGLFGLATYSAEQRVKEIGVRKVLGGTVFNLASLLSKDFLKLVLIANIIAFPVGWWAVNKWLQEFAYHIEIKWWIFLIAGLSACVIAILTVSYQAIKAASANPVKCLRTE